MQIAGRSKVSPGHSLLPHSDKKLMNLHDCVARTRLARIRSAVHAALLYLGCWLPSNSLPSSNTSRHGEFLNIVLLDLLAWLTKMSVLVCICSILTVTVWN